MSDSEVFESLVCDPNYDPEKSQH